jgi:hypothetical protein
VFVLPEVARIEAGADDVEPLGCAMNALDRESCTSEVGKLKSKEDFGGEEEKIGSAAALVLVVLAL